MSWQELSITQPYVVKMLRNSFNKGRIAHAYLFSGNKGTGKKKAALKFAQMLLCKQKSDNPCDICNNCQRINHNAHPNIVFIKPNGNTIKKEQIKLLQGELSKTSFEVGPKVCIIEHVDKMSISAANSLLKFLEEPPIDTYIILITENANQLLDTIISRSQVLSFISNDVDNLINTLIKDNISEGIAKLVANLTNNHDEAIKLSNDKVFIKIKGFAEELVKSIYNDNLSSFIYFDTNRDKILDNREKQDLFIEMLLFIYKDMINIKLNKEDFVFSDFLDKLIVYQRRMTQNEISDKINKILYAKKQLKYNVNNKIIFDRLLLSLEGGN